MQRVAGQRNLCWPVGEGEIAPVPTTAPDAPRAASPAADQAVVLLNEAYITIDIVFSVVEMPGSMDDFALAQWAGE